MPVSRKEKCRDLRESKEKLLRLLKKKRDWILEAERMVKRSPGGGWPEGLWGTRKDHLKKMAKINSVINQIEEQYIEYDCEVMGNFGMRSKSSYGNWKKKAPKRVSRRRKMKKDFGSDCFLLPNGTKKNRSPMFPVCDKDGEYDCGGIRAARTRASQWKYDKVKRDAERLGKRIGCSWVK